MKVAVLGVGLIGGSVGLAARERLGAEVSGWDPGEGVLAAALERGAVDRAAPSAAAALEGAEAAFVATPVGALPAAVRAALAAAGEDCVVTDVGSTKRAVVEAADDERFIGGHPLAGAETAGVRHARAELFDGATWYLTPTPRHPRHAVRAPAPAAGRPGRPPRGPGRRDARPHARRRLPPAPRAGQRAGRAGRPGAVGGGRAAARHAGRASAT